jgi:hypothetical protein
MTIFIFDTPSIQVCRKIVGNGSTGDISGLPFVVGALNCAVWLRYGLLIGDAPLMLVNGIGCLLQIGFDPTNSIGLLIQITDELIPGSKPAVFRFLYICTYIAVLCIVIT